MTTEQRRALAGTIPTTEVIKDAVTYPRDRLGEPLDISPERFEAWLTRVRREAKAEAWDEGCEAFEIAHKCDNAEPWGHLRDNPYRQEQTNE